MKAGLYAVKMLIIVKRHRKLLLFFVYYGIYAYTVTIYLQMKQNII